MPPEIQIGIHKFRSSTPSSFGGFERKSSTLECRANKNGGTIDPCDVEIKQCIGLEKEDYDKEYEESYADTVVVRRKGHCV